MSRPAQAELTRRGFLVLGGGAVAAVGLGGCGWPMASSQPPIVSEATALTGGFPRMLAFRQSETLVPLLPYSEWEPIFGQFSGIIGKALQEERSDNVGPQTVEYFTRFKAQFPDKLVLLHLNGRARLPQFETQRWSAGWWLYRAGSVLTAAIGPGDTLLGVASTDPFKLRKDPFGGVGDDIVLAPKGSDGKPDFSAAEQVRLAGINKSGSKLRVVRGKYGTSARSFPKGSYLAPHEYAGPWSATDDRVWFFNVSSMCPPDASGRTAVDELLDQFRSWFAPGGVLAAFDGLELDVFQFPVEQRDGIDADCDGEVDLALRAGVDTYLEGQIQLAKGMREILGSDRYLITDGAVGQQPDSASVSGIEIEGFPTLHDYDMTHWSQALMALELWGRAGANPRLSYPLHKLAASNDYPVSFNRFRLTLAAALATGSSVSWFNDIGGEPRKPNDVVVGDELVAGTARTPGWLGAVRGAAIHLAERGADQLDGDGVSWPSRFRDTFDGPEVTFAVRGPGNSVLVVSRRKPSDSLSFSIPDLPITGPDVVLAVDLLAVKRAAYPATIGRPVTITVTGDGGEVTQALTVPTSWFHAVVGFHGVGPGPITVTIVVEGDTPLRLRGLRVFAAPDAIVRGFTRGAMFANPSGSEVSFDVADLFPGRRFARIEGNLDQDPATNDGSVLGSTLAVPALDALVVRAV